MMSFIEVAIPLSSGSDELLGLLQDSGVLGAWEEHGVLRVYWPAGLWNERALEELKQGLLRMGKNDAASRVEVSSIPDQDWNSLWSASLAPLRIGRRLRLRQSWHPPDPSFDGVELVIDPKRAFGTGYHATTQLVLEWLEDRIQGKERVLDIGTGTGILAMAALRLGAASALGIDNDPVAIECALENAVANGFGAELELRLAAARDLEQRTFDAIVANLDRNTVLSIVRSLKSCLAPWGWICLSGLLIEDCKEVTQAVSDAGAQVTGRREREEWAALEVKI